MAEFSTRVEQVSLNGIRDVFEAADGDAINLGLGQPDFSAPDHVHQAAVEAISSSQADAYSPNRGMTDLRAAIQDRYERDSGLTVDPADVIVTAGGSEALHLVLEAHVDPGQEVIVPDPGFVSYAALTRTAGGKPVSAPLREDLTLDPAVLEEAITDETAAFIVNSPANPTGAVQTEADMREFARIADEHDVVCLSDEVYERIIFDGEHCSPLSFTESNNVVVVSSCSKTYSMTGWRLGWVIGSSERIEQMLKVHQFVQGCASVPAQYAAEAALTGPQEPVDEMVDAFERRRNIVLDGLADAGLQTAEPQGAFYVMPEVPEGWCDEMIDRGVVVLPGSVFGANGAGYARLSYATGTEELKEALETAREATQAVL